MIVHTPIRFDYLVPIRRKATARARDPQVSHDAAARVELGKAERQRQWIAHALALNGDGLTVAELARVAPYPDWTGHALGKRMTEISTIQPTGQTRDGMRIWELV